MCEGGVEEIAQAGGGRSDGRGEEGAAVGQRGQYGRASRRVVAEVHRFAKEDFHVRPYEEELAAAR